MEEEEYIYISTYLLRGINLLQSLNLLVLRPIKILKS